jgi:hypothetical protein
MANREKPFKLDMDFDEALRRFAQTDPQELSEPNKAGKKTDRQKRIPRKRNESKN